MNLLIFELLNKYVYDQNKIFRINSLDTESITKFHK